MFTFYTIYDFQRQNEKDQEEIHRNKNNSNVNSFCTPDKIWIIPGHIFLSSEGGHSLQSVVTNDCSSGYLPRCDPDLTLSFQNPVVELCTARLPSDNALIIVMQNGDVHVWKYDICDMEWCKQFTFQLRSGNSETYIQAVVFNEQLEFAIWCEKHGSSAYERSVFVRKYSTTAPRTISDFCLNDYISETILTHCPEVNFCNLGALTTLTFNMQNSPNIFMIWCKESGLSMLDTKGMVLWSDSSSPYKRFAKILTCTLNVWESSGENIVIGHASNKVHNRLYILAKSGDLLSFNSSGHLCAKIGLPLEKELCVSGFYIYSNFVFIFSEFEILIYNFHNGASLGSLQLPNQIPLSGVWYHSSHISVFGFYTGMCVYRIVLKDYLSILSSSDDTAILLGNADIDFLFKMNCILNGKNVPNFEIAKMAIPSLQSKAMVLALVHHCGELTASGDENLNNKVIERLVNCLPEAPNHKLKRLLRTLVECFLKLHYYCSQQSP